jgi:hypothetical protein
MSFTTVYPINISSPAQITREEYNNVGSSPFTLGSVPRGFRGSTNFEIWDSASGGTQLTEGVDYTLGGANTYYGGLASQTIYTTVEIDNVTYQTGAIFITYKTIGSFTASDFYNTIQESRSGYLGSKLLNNNFQEWQERQNTTTTTDYAADQWYHTFTATSASWLRSTNIVFAQQGEYISQSSITADAGEYWQILQPVPSYRSREYKTRKAQFNIQLKQQSITAGSQNLQVYVHCPSVKDDFSTFEILATSPLVSLDGNIQNIPFEFDLSGSTTSGYTVDDGCRYAIRFIQAGATGNSVIYINHVDINAGEILLPHSPENDLPELLTFFQDNALSGIASTTSILMVSGDFKTKMFSTPSVASFDSGPATGNVSGSITRVGVGTVAVTISSISADQSGLYFITFTGTPLVLGDEYILKMRFDARIP